MTAPDRTSGLQRVTQYASGDVNHDPDQRGRARSRDLRRTASRSRSRRRRTVFPLGAPAFVSTQAAVPGLVELYDADLGNETLTRVTSGYEGGLPEHPEIESGNEDRYTRSARRRPVSELRRERNAAGLLLDGVQPRVRRRELAAERPAGRGRRRGRLPRAEDRLQRRTDAAGDLSGAAQPLAGTALAPGGERLLARERRGSDQGQGAGRRDCSLRARPARSRRRAPTHTAARGAPSRRRRRPPTAPRPPSR